MKKVIAILCMLLMVFALAACGAPKPESTVEQFCEAMKKYDVAGMNVCLVQPCEDIGEISDDEYFANCPQGYECWSCGYCGKWTGNFK